MKEKIPVEVTVKYATVVDTMAEAWTFIMTHLDEVGGRPSVSISPVWLFTEEDEDEPVYEVVVSGMREEG